MHLSKVSQTFLLLFALGFLTCKFDNLFFLCVRADVYGTCSGHTDCPSNARCRPNSCDGYICLCDEGFVASQDKRRCLKAARIGEPCLNLTSRCVSLLAVCTEGTCRCLDSFVETNDGRCKLPGTSFVGESCGKCEYPAHCVGGVCRCVDNYRPLAFDEYWVDPFSTLQCRPQGYAINKCNGTEIPVPLPLQALTRSTSIYPDKEMSGKTQPAVFGSCTSHAECPKFAKCKPGSCDGFLCLCDSGFIASEDRSSCLRARRIAEACNSLTDRCMSPFSSCTNSFCECLDIFQPTADGRCKLPGNNFLGEPCLNSEQCEYPSKCVNGSCLCVEPYRQITHEEFWMDPMITSQCRPLGFSVWKCNGTQLDIPEELSSRQATTANNRDVIPTNSSVRTTTEGYRSFSQFHPSNFTPNFLSAYDANNLQVSSRSTPLTLTTQILEKSLNFYHSVDVSEPHNLISLTPPEKNMDVRERSPRSDQDAREYTTPPSKLVQNSESQKNTANLTNSSNTPFNRNLTSNAQMNVDNSSFDQTRLIDRLSRSGILRLFDDRISMKFLKGSLAISSINGSQDIMSYSSTQSPKSTADSMATKGHTTLKNKTDLPVDLRQTSINSIDKMKIPFLSQTSFVTGTRSQSTNTVIDPVGKDPTYLTDGKGYEEKDNNWQSTTSTSTRQDSFLKNTNDKLFLIGYISHTTTFNPPTVTVVTPTSETNLPLPFKMPTTEIYSSFSEVPKGFTKVTSSTQTEALKGNTVYSIPAQTGNSVLSTLLLSSKNAVTLTSLQKDLEISKRVATIPAGTNDDNDFISDLTSKTTYNEEITTPLPNDFIDTRLEPVEITNVGGNLFLTNLGGFSRMLDGVLTFDDGSTAILFTSGQSEISHGRELLHTVNNMCLEVVHKEGKTSVIKRQDTAVTSYYNGTLSLMYYQLMHDNQTETRVKGRPSEKVENASSEIFWEILRSSFTPGNKTSIFITKAERPSNDKRRVGKGSHSFVKFDSDRDQTLLAKNDLIASIQASTTMYSNSYRDWSATASLEQGRKNMTDYLRKLKFSIMEYVEIILPILRLIDSDDNVQKFPSDESFVYFINGRSHLNTDSGKLYVMQGGEEPMINIEVVGNGSVILESGILQVQSPHSSLNFDVNLTEVHFRNSSLFITFNSSSFVVEVIKGSADIVQWNHTRTIHSNDRKIVLSHNHNKNIRMYSQHIMLKAELNGLVLTYHKLSHTTTYQKDYISYIENTNGKSEIRIGTMNNVLIFHGGGTDIVHINGSGLMIEDMFDLLVENKYGTVEAEMTETKQLIVLDQGISKVISFKYAVQMEQFNGTMCVWQEKSFVRQTIEIMNKTEETSNVEDTTVPLSMTMDNPDNYAEVISPDASKQFMNNRSDSTFVTYAAMTTSRMSLIETRLSGIDNPDLTSGDNESTLVNIPTETTSNMAVHIATAKSMAKLNQPTFHDSDIIANMNAESKERGKHVEAREDIYAEPILTRTTLNNTLFHEIRYATARKDSNSTLPFAAKILIETVTETSNTSRNTTVNTAIAMDTYVSTANQSDVNGTIFTETVVATTTEGDSHVILARPITLRNGMPARPVTLRTAHVTDAHSSNNGLNVSTLNDATLYETNDSKEMSTVRIRRHYTSVNLSEHFATSTNNYSELNADQTELYDVLFNERVKLGLGFGQSSSAMRESTFNATSETNNVHRNTNANNLTVPFKRNNLSVTFGMLYVKSSDMHLETTNISGTYTKAKTDDFKATALEDVVTSTAITATSGTIGETTFKKDNFVEQIPNEPLSNSTLPYNGSRSTLYIAKTPSISTLTTAETHSTLTLEIAESPSTLTLSIAETPSTLTLLIAESPSTSTLSIAETPSTLTLATAETPSTSTSTTADVPNTSTLDIVETPSTLTPFIAETPSTSTLVTALTPNTSTLDIAETPSTLTLSIAEIPSTSTSTTADVPNTSMLDIVETPNISRLTIAEAPSTSTITIPETAGTSTFATAETSSTLSLDIADIPSTSELTIAETPNKSTLHTTKTPRTTTLTIADTPSTSTLTTAETLSTSTLTTAETSSTSMLTTAETPSISVWTTAMTPSTSTLTSAETPSMSALTSAETPSISTLTSAETPRISTLTTAETPSSSRKAYHSTGKQDTKNVTHSKQDATVVTNLRKEIKATERKPELILEKSKSDNSILIPLNIAGILAAAVLATLIALVLRSRKRRQTKDKLNKHSTSSSSVSGDSGGSQVPIRIPRPSVKYEPYYVKDGWQTISTSFSSKQSNVSPHVNAWQEQPDPSSDRISADFEA